ncbi:hypothetical protein, partial [Pseudomonas laurylsulfatiphila]|uniref:hypothetical protein n=1 Tax=Pseudomonas laurylsulfatiphila TaxID=2011015 RepID=UPI003D25ECE5
QLWELARDGAVSGGRDVGSDGLIAGKPAPTRICGECEICAQQKSTVGAGLPAMAQCQAAGMLVVMASSRAGSLLQGSGVNTRFVFNKNQLWELARDGAVSGGRDVGSDGLIAGKPAPTRIWVNTRFVFNRNQLWELARDGAVSGGRDVGSDGLFASRLTPTRICGEYKICVQQKSTVGASLLAMAACWFTLSAA